MAWRSITWRDAGVFGLLVAATCMLSANEREEVESLELVIQPADGDQFSVDLTRFDDESIQCLVYKRPAGSVRGANPQPTEKKRLTNLRFALECIRSSIV